MAGRLVFLSSSFFSLFLSTFAKRDGQLLARDPPSHGFTVQSHVANGGLSASQAGVGIGVDDTMDFQYRVNSADKAYLPAAEFEVLLDSGSSDLWVRSDTPLKLTNDSGLVASISYGKGFVRGPIQFAELQLGQYTIPSQAFINVNETRDLDDAVGILGIAFDLAYADSTEAYIQHFWGNDTTLGRTPLANILNQNQSTKPVFDVSLGRASDLDEFSEGLFVIGEHAPQYAAVEQAPILPQVTKARWSALVEGLSVNGQNFTFTTKSEVSTVPQGKLVAFMDTGTSLPEIPQEAVDFIYGNIPGSVNNNGTWYVPCQSGANLTWYLGGQAFPTHPLDLTIFTNVTLPMNGNNDSNVTLCVGAYQAGTPPYQDIDMVLGDNFLRNVYVSFNFGQNDGRTENGTGSYIQMLSTTNQSDAWTDFILSRSTALSMSPFNVDPNILAQIPGALDSITAALGLGVPPPPNATSTSSSTITPTPSSSSTSVSSARSSAAAGAFADLAGAVSSDSGSNSDDVVSLLDKYGPVVIGLLAGNILVMSLLCIIALVACMRGKIRGGATTRSLPANYVPVSFKDKVTEDPEFNAPVHNYSD